MKTLEKKLYLSVHLILARGAITKSDVKWIDPSNWDPEGDLLKGGGEVACGLDPTNALPSERIPDCDGDNLSNGYEIDNNLDPFNPSDSIDSDNDGLSNLEEFNLGTDPQDPDSDNDGLRDGGEVDCGLDPLNAIPSEQTGDCDNDTIPNGYEAEHSLDPFDASDTSLDPDKDGLTNLEEYHDHGTDPQNPDSDGDGLIDGGEVDCGLDPANDLPSELTGDCDDDGMLNGYEATYNLNPFNPDDANLDYDNDGLTNLEEHGYNTNPRNFDTDGDLIPDKWEIDNAIDPTDATGDNGASGDPDGDGLDNFGEYLNETDPHNPDTDGDCQAARGLARSNSSTCDDGSEVDNGSDPNDPSDGGEPPDPEMVVEVPFNIYGDYAAWEMTVTGKGPDDTRSLKLRTNNPGGTKTKPLKLHKGNSYEIRMRCVKSRETGSDDNKIKWYCWQAQIEGLPTQATFSSYSSTRNGNAKFFLVGGHWIVDNREGLLTTHVHMNDNGGGNVAGSLVAKLHYIEFVTPSKDPVKEPKDNGDGQNEFTFDTANPGVLTMNLKAKIKPSGIASEVKDKLKFLLDDIGNSTLAWGANNSGGKPTVSGDDLTATLTFTGLPTNNDDFGAKNVWIEYEGTKVQEQGFEVFFPKAEKNHPGNSSNSDWPNWMYYWLQTLTPLGSPAPTFKFGSSSFFTPGTTEITLSNGESGSYSAPYATHNPLKGIDNFSWTVIHESQHYEDWINLWSNNYSDWLNNHKGKSGTGDDKDGDRIPNGTEDADLNGTYDAGDMYDWQVYNTPTPGRPSSIVNDFEDWNCQRNKNATGDHSKDWSNPGMQHKTKDKYDD